MIRKAFTSLLLFASLTAGAQTTNLLNDNNLNGWQLFTDPTSSVKAEEVFTIKDGVVDCIGNPFGYMYTRENYQDFQLHVEWRWPGQAVNSGIFLYVQNEEKLWPCAVECQLHVGDAGDFVLLGGSDVKEFVLPKGQERPKFPVVKKSASSSENLSGEWNCADITCKKGVITVYINGVFQNQGHSAKKKGHIALQSEGGHVQFRNVRLTKL